MSKPQSEGPPDSSGAPGEAGEPAFFGESMLEALLAIARQTTSPPADEGQPVPAELRPHGTRYGLLGELGRGGMGVVYRCLDGDLGREVAMKVLRAELADRHGMARRFVEEAQIGGQLQHPGVAPVHEIGMDPGGQPYFTMKLVKGETLAAMLAARKDLDHDQPRFLSIFERICQTMAYAHARRTVHRDLKPANVMVGAFGEVNVMDWGLARVLDAGAGSGADAGAGAGERGEPDGAGAPAAAGAPATPTLTPVQLPDWREGARSEDGTVVGTAAYMPPEQALGLVSRVDERSDVFALGAILCEILTGLPPYTGGRAEALAAAGEGDTRAALARLQACHADAQVVEIARACLQTARDDRPRDAGVVAGRIASYLASVEERARAAELSAVAALARAEHDRRARRLTQAVAGLVVLLVVVAGGGYLWLRDLQRQEASHAVGEAMATAQRLAGEAEAAGLDGVAVWEDAASAARRAESLITSALDAVHVREVRELAAVLARRALQAQLDHDMVVALETIRLDHGDSLVWGAEVPPYAEAFAGYGIDLESMSPDAAAGAIRGSHVRDQLVLALDGWASHYLKDDTRSQGMLDRLVATADLADDDPWRRQLRAAIRKRDPAELRRLAGDARPDQVPALSLDLLASQLGRNGELALAEQVWRDAQALHPSDFWINHNLSIVVSAPDEALAFCMAALSIRPGSAHIWRDLGDARLRLGRVEAARAAYGRAFTLDPGNTALRRSAAAELSNHGEMQEALALFREVLADDPTDFMATFSMGVTLRKMGLEDDAVSGSARAAFEQTLLLTEDAGTGSRRRVYHGAALLQLGRFEEAAAVLEECARAGADLLLARKYLGEALMRLDRYADAVAPLEQAAAEESSFGNHYNLGLALLRSAEPERAFAALMRAVELDTEGLLTDAPLALAEVGRQLQNWGDPERALIATETAARMAPHDSRFQISLGDLQKSVGNSESAIAAYRAALEAGHQNRDSIVMRIAGVHDADGDLDAAIMELERGVHEAPSWLLLWSLGAGLLKRSAEGDLVDALAALDRALQLAPDDARVHATRGQVLQKMKRLEEAIAAYEECQRHGGDAAARIRACRELLELERELTAVLEEGARLDGSREARVLAERARAAGYAAAAEQLEKRAEAMERRGE